MVTYYAKRMRSVWLWIAVAWFLAACDVPSPGGKSASDLQPASWSDLEMQGKAAYDHGNFADAADLLQRALSGAEAQYGKGDRHLESVLDTLGDVQRELDRREDADATYQRLLSLRQSVFGERSSEAAMAWNEIGQTWAVSDSKRAKRALEQAKTLLDGLSDADEGSVALVLHNLAAVDYMVNENSSAQKLWLRVLDIRRRLHGEKSSQVATTLYNLAMLADADKRDADSSDLFQRALVAYEASKGPDHPDVALCLVALAQNACAHGKSCATTAIPQLERALAIQRRAYGETHPILSDGLKQLAVLQEQAKRFDAAIPLRQQLLTIAQTKYGATSAVTAYDHDALATDYEAIGDAENAKRHREISEKISPMDADDSDDRD